MNHPLNAAISDANVGESSNHYLNVILEGKVKTLADFAQYATAEFWGCILDQVPADPVRTIDCVLRDLKNVSEGSKTLERIDADLEDCFGEQVFGDTCSDFAEAMRDEVGHLMLAIKYLLQERATEERSA